MTRSLDPEIKMMKVLHRALSAVPKSYRLRALAYFVSREADVGTCEASEWLYRLASAEARKERTPEDRGLQ